MLVTNGGGPDSGVGPKPAGASGYCAHQVRVDAIVTTRSRNPAQAVATSPSAIRTWCAPWRNAVTRKLMHAPILALRESATDEESAEILRILGVK